MFVTGCTRRTVMVALAVAALCGRAAPAAAACTITTGGVAFGTYNVLSSTPLDTLATIVYRCDPQDKDIRIELSAGSSGSFMSRTLKSGSESLQYQLYLDSARTVVWGDGTGATSAFFDHNPQNRVDVYARAYARIPPGQDVRPGQYTDTITVTVNF